MKIHQWHRGSGREMLSQTTDMAEVPRGGSAHPIGGDESQLDREYQQGRNPRESKALLTILKDTVFLRTRYLRAETRVWRLSCQRTAPAS